MCVVEACQAGLRGDRDPPLFWKLAIYPGQDAMVHDDEDAEVYDEKEEEGARMKSQWMWRRRRRAEKH